MAADEPAKDKKGKKKKDVDDVALGAKGVEKAVDKFKKSKTKKEKAVREDEEPAEMHHILSEEIEGNKKKSKPSKDKEPLKSQ